MNYAQTYVNLINRAKQRSASDLDPNQKYEWHHYFPVCFWQDRKINTKTVALTLREHWVAHRLLFKMFPGKGTATALMFMSKRDPKMNSRKFETIRRVTSEYNWTKNKNRQGLFIKTNKSTDSRWMDTIRGGKAEDVGNGYANSRKMEERRRPPIIIRKSASFFKREGQASQ